jgi:hypothetical protein
MRDFVWKTRWFILKLGVNDAMSGLPYGGYLIGPGGWQISLGIYGRWFHRGETARGQPIRFLFTPAAARSTWGKWTGARPV